jgi:spore coat polysaccharide biosynthesis protein SpsF
MKKIDAILACRVQGSRLYAKPLQNLSTGGPTILESLINYISSIESVNSTILAISEEDENNGFVKIADKLGLNYIKGDQADVLLRIINAAEKYETEIIFRTTSECPFMLYNYADRLIDEFVKGDYDWGVYIDTPEGTGFELIKKEALLLSHKMGENKHRSELATLYIFENQKDFKILKMQLPENLRRPEVRLTVDYAEDLIFCQQIWKSLKKENTLIEINQIIEFWDNNPTLRKPLEDIGIDWGHGRLLE